MPTGSSDASPETGASRSGLRRLFGVFSQRYGICKFCRSLYDNRSLVNDLHTNIPTLRKTSVWCRSCRLMYNGLIHFVHDWEQNEKEWKVSASHNKDGELMSVVLDNSRTAAIKHIEFFRTTGEYLCCSLERFHGNLTDDL